MDVKLEKITCCAEGCHVPFWITSAHVSRLRETHELFYCPNGHQQHFSQETEEEKFKRLYEKEQERRFAAEDRARSNYSNYEQQIRFTAAQKGLVTKLRRKLGEGKQEET